MKRSAIHPRIVGAFDAKTNLSRYLADAQKGIVTIISIRGRPAAKIVPADARVVGRMAEPQDLIQRARAIRKRARRGRESLAKLVSTGRP